VVVEGLPDAAPDSWLQGLIADMDAYFAYGEATSRLELAYFLFFMEWWQLFAELLVVIARHPGGEAEGGRLRAAVEARVGAIQLPPEQMRLLAGALYPLVPEAHAPPPAGPHRALDGGLRARLQDRRPDLHPGVVQAVACAMQDCLALERRWLSVFERVQRAINAALGRPAPERPLTGRDLSLTTGGTLRDVLAAWTGLSLEDTA
jgi:hypothetical protein